MTAAFVPLLLMAQTAVSGAVSATAPASPHPPLEIRRSATPVPDPPRPAPATLGDVRARLLPPRVRIGRGWSIEPIAKIQLDLSRFDPIVDASDQDALWRRRRFGVKGELFGRVDFELEREFGDAEDPWRDAYAELTVVDLLVVTGGHFRVPFSLDGLTGSTSHDFVNRTLGGNTIAPGRDLGVMVHGRTGGRRLTYAIGGFHSSDTDTSTRGLVDDDKGTSNPGRTAAGRLTLQPLDALDALPRGVRNLELGGNVTWSSVPEGLHGLEGRSVYRHRFFAPVYLKGDRIRAGVDVALAAGPTSLKAEWMQATDERRGQGLGDVDLPNAVTRAWYVAGTWMITGEAKDDFASPRRPFPHAGLGAIELVGRFERLAFGSASTAGEPAFATPRAAHLRHNRDDVVTLGLTWHLNRWSKVLGNAIRESFADVDRAPIAGRATYWSFVARMQFAL